MGNASVQKCVWNTLPAPGAVIGLIKCGCKKGCESKCSCCKNALPCTPLCGCYGYHCNSLQKDAHDELYEREDEEDNE